VSGGRSCVSTARSVKDEEVDIHFDAATDCRPTPSTHAWSSARATSNYRFTLCARAFARAGCVMTPARVALSAVSMPNSNRYQTSA
jgi:hypothetical protein